MAWLRTSPATRSAASPLMSTTATFMPASASAWATPSPIPLPAPVTTAVFPWSSCMPLPPLSVPEGAGVELGHRLPVPLGGRLVVRRVVRDGEPVSPGVLLDRVGDSGRVVRLAQPLVLIRA